MTEQERRQNDEFIEFIVSSDTESEKEKENETNTKSGRPQSGVWKHFDRGESKGKGHWEGTCQYCKNSFHVLNQVLCVHIFLITVKMFLESGVVILIIF